MSEAELPMSCAQHHPFMLKHFHACDDKLTCGVRANITPCQSRREAREEAQGQTAIPLPLAGRDFNWEFVLFLIVLFVFLVVCVVLKGKGITSRDSV